MWEVKKDCGLKTGILGKSEKKKKKVNEASKPENVTRQRNGEGKEMGRHDTFEAILLPWYYY